MTINTRTPVASGLAAVSLAVLFSVLALPATANATPIRIGDFFFDRPDTVSATIHVSNDSPDLFTSFTVQFVNDVLFDDNSTGVDTPSFTDSLAAGISIQLLPIDFAPPFSTVTPLTATLSAFTFFRPGTISFSPDGGTTFVTSAVLDLTADDAGFGIFVDEPPTDPQPVPEPATLLLLASGLAASRFRRARHRSSLKPLP